MKPELKGFGAGTVLATVVAVAVLTSTGRVQEILRPGDVAAATEDAAPFAIRAGEGALEESAELKNKIETLEADATDARKELAESERALVNNQAEGRQLLRAELQADPRNRDVLQFSVRQARLACQAGQPQRAAEWLGLLLEQAQAGPREPALRRVWSRLRDALLDFGMRFIDTLNYMRAQAGLEEKGAELFLLACEELAVWLRGQWWRAGSTRCR